MVASSAVNQVRNQYRESLINAKLAGLAKRLPHDFADIINCVDDWVSIEYFRMDRLTRHRRMLRARRNSKHPIPLFL